MALVANPQIESVNMLVDGVESGCGCGSCAGCDSSSTKLTTESMGDAVGWLGNIAAMSPVKPAGLGNFNQYDPLDQGIPFPTTAQRANPNYSWTDVFQQGAMTGFGIIRDIFGGPRPGTFMTSGPQGSSIQRLPENSLNAGANLNFGVTPIGVGGGMGLGTVLLIGGVILLASRGGGK
jgi:hypothetical protein